MHLICNRKEQTCEILNCDHNKPHERKTTCLGKQCVLFEDKFISDTKECVNCYCKDDCQIYRDKGNQKCSSIHDYCTGTRNLRKYDCECVPVD